MSHISESNDIYSHLLENDENIRKVGLSTKGKILVGLSILGATYLGYELA